MTAPGDLPLLSMNAVKAKDKAGWLALFEPDALVEDPVGGHPYLDPAGQGQRGHDAIGRFYDTFSAAQDSMEYEVHHLVACAGACDVTMRFTMTDGSVSETRMINIYKASPSGRIASLRSFWKQG
jgi:steroid delta-isomerase